MVQDNLSALSTQYWRVASRKTSRISAGWMALRQLRRLKQDIVLMMNSSGAALLSSLAIGPQAGGVALSMILKRCV